MSMNWIHVTPQFQEGVTLINLVEPAKLRLLLNRIVSHLENKQLSYSPFSEEEVMKLEKSLGLGLREVHLVIDTASLILQQAAYHVIKPDILKNKLTDSLLNQESTAVVVAVWSANAGAIIEGLRKRSVLPHQFADLTWLINVETSSNLRSRMKEPTAVLELLLASSENNHNNTKFKLEMRKPEVQKLYQKLEEVQVQLDALK